MSYTRRDFLSVTGKSLIGITVGSTAFKSFAAEKAPLDPSSAAAKAFNYVAASDKAGQNCANCAFVAGQKGEQLNCPLFQQNTVASGGWCKSWVNNPQAN